MGQSKLFYFTGIENLRVCYKLCNLCIDKSGDYVENKSVLVRLPIA